MLSSKKKYIDNIIKSVYDHNNTCNYTCYQYYFENPADQYPPDPRIIFLNKEASNA